MKLLEFIQQLTENYETSMAEFKKQGATKDELFHYVKGGPQSFFTVHNNYSGNEKNIDWWSAQKDQDGKKDGWKKLKAFMDKKRSTPSKSSLKKVSGDFITLQDDDTWNIIVPLSHEASCYHGKNTPWCTTKAGQPWFSKYFYIHGVTLVYLYNKILNQKWANVFYNLDRTHDSYDHPPEAFDQANTSISLKEFTIETHLKVEDVEKMVYQVLPEIEKKRKENKATDLFSMIKDLKDNEDDEPIFNAKKEKVEEMILARNSVVGAFQYVREIIKHKFPKFEKLIAKEAVTAYTYAEDYLHDAFPLGEPAMAQDKQFAFGYAKLIGKRFLAGEKVISKDAYLSYWYAKDIVKGKWKEGEPAIIEDGKYILDYITFVLHHNPWSEAEPEILKSFSRTLWYTLRVIKGRWPKGEHLIAKDGSPYEIGQYLEICALPYDWADVEDWKKEILGPDYTPESLSFKEFVLLNENFKTARESFLKFISTSHGRSYSDEDTKQIEKNVDDYIATFRKIQNRLKGDQKNIDYWAKQGWNKFSSFVSNISKTPSVSSIKKNKGKVITLQDDNDWLVIILLTHEASCYYGSGTDWCTTKQGQPWFSKYFFRDNVTLVYFIPKDKQYEKYAAAFYTRSERVECFNTKDKEIQLSEFTDETGLDMEEYKDMVVSHYDEIEKEKRISINSDVYAMLKKIKDENIKSPNPFLEDLILAKKATNAAFIYLSYLYHVLEHPFTKFDKLFVTDPDIAYNYAANILHSRFKLGEPIIIQKGELSVIYHYAQNVIKGPWPEAEDKLKTEVDYIFLYAQSCLMKRWKEGEQELLKFFESSDIWHNYAILYNYSKDVIKGPWKEAEKYCAKNYNYAYYYAMEILKGPFPEAEYKMVMNISIYDLERYFIMAYPNSKETFDNWKRRIADKHTDKE